MKQIVVLICESKPGEQLSAARLDLKEATMAALDRCRELGYTVAEGVVTDNDASILQHVFINAEQTALRTDGPPERRKLVFFEP